MLIVPLHGKLSWRTLPIVTILIILINCVIYFAVGPTDERYYSESSKIYFESGLAEMEIDKYIAYRENKGLPLSPVENVTEKVNTYHYEMMNDREFMDLLEAEKIITPEDFEYQKWKDLRGRIKGILKNLSAEKYGFIPTEHKPVTVLTCMFMHGSFGHLLGNMIFLWLVGCVLEIGLGRFNYIILYLLGGACATALHYSFDMNSTIPIIGASGAIAALMGAYTVAYGKTKINVFYSLGFYFNYTKIYAILLLPMWLGYEIFNLLFYKGSNVAYLAHIGGLIGGAVIGFVSVKLFRKEKHEIFKEEPKDKIQPLMTQALKKIETLDLTGARELIVQVLAIDPENAEALKQLFNIDKLQPDSDEFHKTANRRMTFLCREQGEQKELYNAYQEYCKLVGKPRFSTDLLLRLAVIFAETGETTASKNILQQMIALAPNHPRLPSVLLDIANIGKASQKNDFCAEIIKILHERYPQSTEAAWAKKTAL